MILCRYCYDTMELADIIKVLQPMRVIGRGKGLIKGLTYDSRLVMKDYLFAAIQGSELNGLDFIDDALQRGATAIITETEIDPPMNATVIVVKDARNALARVANAFHRYPSSCLDVVGITGTNGKTTTSYLIRDVLTADLRRPGLIGTVAYEFGDRMLPASRTTPEAPELQAMLDQMRDVGCRSAVMEVSSHALDQQRVAGIEFDVAVFTNLTQDHLDYHEDFESYFKAKATLFTGLSKKSGHAIINIDDPWGERLAAMPEICAKVITYGFTEHAMVRAHSVQLDDDGSTFMLTSPWGSSDVRIKLMGRFNVSNALAAIAACASMGVDFDQVINHIELVASVPGRLETIPSKVGQVYVDYAHTDDALSNVLTTLKELVRGRLICVFGCGGNRDVDKRPKMAAVAQDLADFTIVTSDNPRRESPVVAGFTEASGYRVVEDRQAAIAAGIEMLEKDDILLIAGKGHENYQEVGQSVIPFDDREVARQLLQARNL
jgi:UDP-N-acetylmuramoyl-L-alanyl-D-glutamate--2,6-diaminopimelate ligase